MLIIVVGLTAFLFGGALATSISELSLKQPATEQTIPQAIVDKIDDTYTKIGRQHMRFVSVGEDIFHRETESGDVIVFSVTFKVNDPVTDITLSK